MIRQWNWGIPPFRHCHWTVILAPLTGQAMHVVTHLFRRLAILVLLPLLLNTGCEAATPPPELRWRFVGGTTLEQQTNAPALASWLLHPSSQALRPLLVTNLARAWWNSSITNSVAPEQALESARRMIPDLLDGLSLGETVVTPGGRREFAVALPLTADRAEVWQTSWLNFFSLVHGNQGHPKVSYQQGWVLAVSDESVLDIRQTRKELATIPAEASTGLRLEMGKPLPTALLKVLVTEGVVKSELKVQTIGAQPARPKAWEIPEVIRFPFVKFTAAREVEPWLRQLPWMRDLPGGAVPSQLFLWSQPSNSPFSAFQSYASARVERPAEFLKAAFQHLNSALHPTNRGVGLMLDFESNTNDAGFVIKGFPYVTPRFYPQKEGQRDFVTMGMFVPRVITNQIPAQILEAINQTNLVYYDWEVTSQTAVQWNALSQVYEMGANHMPKTSPGSTWLTTSVTNTPACLTEGTITGPHEVTFRRNSAIGLTSAEISVVV